MPEEIIFDVVNNKIVKKVATVTQNPDEFYTIKDLKAEKEYYLKRAADIDSLIAQAIDAGIKEQKDV